MGTDVTQAGAEPPKPPAEMTMADVERFLAAAGTVIVPLLQSQQMAQKEAMSHDLEKFRLNLAERQRNTAYGFWFMVGLLVLAAAVMAGLLIMGQHQLVLQALVFFSGLGAGYGLGVRKASG